MVFGIIKKVYLVKKEDVNYEGIRKCFNTIFKAEN